MTTTTEPRSELAYRANDGIAIVLFWSKPTNRVTIELIDDRRDQRFEFEVDRRKALDAFYHPYTYATALAAGEVVATREGIRA